MYLTESTRKTVSGDDTSWMGLKLIGKYRKKGYCFLFQKIKDICTLKRIKSATANSLIFSK